jgi:hypothetical protein
VPAIASLKWQPRGLAGFWLRCPPGGLADPVTRRWPAFTPPAVQAGALGMVSVQEGISVTKALIRLRAFAFSNDRLLDAVAEDVVARRLRLG